MHKTTTLLFLTFALSFSIDFANGESDDSKSPLFVFNSDGGAAAIAHIKGKVTREIVCHELNELEGTAVTDFFWCPIVGGNVFIYPTKVGEQMGDNIRDWDKVHPYYREQGRAMADNLRQLIKRGDDPIKMLAARAKELKLRFWLTCRMNEIHEDDDRFMVLRSLFKEKHPELLHGKDYHPEAVYAPRKNYSYAWDYGKAEVREHFLKLFREWLRYDIDGIELDYCRSPCLFPPGEETEGAPLLTDFMTKLRAAIDQTAEQRGHPMKLAIRVPPSLKRCKAAGIDIATWIDRGLVDVITPMDRGYFDPEPELPSFIALARPKGVIVLGGIEPKCRGYRQSNKLNYAAVSSFLHMGADGIYTFNYDCHRLKAMSSKFGGVLQPYTEDELFFLKNAIRPAKVRGQDKQFVISQATGLRLAEDGGIRPLRCRLPVGELKTFSMTVGDDLPQAARENRLRSSQLVVRFQNCAPKANEIELQLNGDTIALKSSQLAPQNDLLIITIASPTIDHGINTIQVGLKEGTNQKGLIHSIDLNVEYAKPVETPKSAT